MIASLTTGMGLIVLVGAVTGVLAGWFKVIRPRYVRWQKRQTAKMDAILGREARYDSITGELVQPPLPGIGVRMANQEQGLIALALTVEKIADSHERLNNHEARLKALEDARVEHVVSRAESAAAFTAMEAAINANPHDFKEFP